MMEDLQNDMVYNLTGSLGLTKNTNLFSGQVKDIKNVIPDFAVFVRGVGGPSADRVFQLSYEIAKPQVSIYVRSSVNSYLVAWEKMKAIYSFLISNIPTGYMDCRCMQSEPQRIREDDKGRYLFMMTFECWIQNNQWILDSGYWDDTRFWFDQEIWDDGV